MRRLRPRTAAAVTATVATGVLAAATLAATAVKPYAVPIGGEYTVTPLFSVDDKVPLLGGAPGQQYRMVGIPDGLGAHPKGDGTSTLFMNHELNSNQLSEPVVGGPKNGGTYVSQWILDADGDPVACRRAYDRVYNEDTFVGPAPDATNATPAFARFCSGFLAGPANGFDRWIYSRTRRSRPRRTRSTAGAASPSRSRTTSFTRCPTSGTTRRRTPSSSRTRARAR